MGNAAVNLPMTAEQFLEWDEKQPERWEFVAGEIFAMVGATDSHATVTGNIYMALRQHLKGTPCRTLSNEVKLRVEAADAYFYPDLMVTCSAEDAQDPLIKRHPMLLVEVLSPATAAYDQGGKFRAYRSVPSLREYLTIDPKTRLSTLYRLGGDGLWVLHPSGRDDPVRLESVDLTITAETLWDEVPG